MGQELIKFLEEILGQENSFGFDSLSLANFNDKESKQLFIDLIKSLDCFKEAKEINFLDLPTFYADKTTHEPLQFKKDLLGDSNSHVETTLSIAYKINDSQQDIFNDIVDLYAIGLGPKRYITDNLGSGVWAWPTIYSNETFQPYKKIEIIYSPESVMDIKNISIEESEKQIKETIINKVNELLNSRKSNIPYTRDLIIRCSSRSLKNKKENN